MKPKKPPAGSPTIPKLFDPAPDPEEQVLRNLTAALDAYLTMGTPVRPLGEAEGEGKAPAPAPLALVAFRWPEPLVKALGEACRCRKVAGTRPFSQGAIAAQALQEWLDRHATPSSPRGLSHD